MARSILPCANRAPARQLKRAITRSGRHAARQELLYALERGDFDEADLRYYPSAEISAAVERRRWSDKVNPFIRWAKRVTEDLRPEDRLSRIRAVLPAGLIGEHALSHVRGHEHFDDPSEIRWRWRRPPPDELSVAERRRRLWEIAMGPRGGLAVFNRSLQAAHKTVGWFAGYEAVVERYEAAPGVWRERSYRRARYEEVGPRTPPRFLGIGDIDRFLDGLTRAREAPPRIWFSRKVWEAYIPRERQAALKEARGGWSRRRLPNPGYHPEWLADLDDTLRKWEATYAPRLLPRSA
jgi:hypothetical protein